LESQQLISYIALGAPATRRSASGDLPFLRPEIGFTPKWYHQALGIEFGEKYHTDPIFRKLMVQQMREEVDRRFPGNRIGKMVFEAPPLDLLTGVYGACTIASMFGVPIRYDKEQWPTSEHFELSDEAMMQLKPINPETNPFFQDILDQVERIASTEGNVIGFVNWQGVLNNAQRLRGQQLFLDMLVDTEMTLNLLECVTTTMIDAARMLQKRQKATGFHYSFFTVSNCLVNMIQPELYQEYILPFDKRIAEEFGVIGIHNCAWDATPYLEDYASIPKVGYLDMGLDSDLGRARNLFPDTRRSLMYTPMDLANKSLKEIRRDLEGIALNYGPCDLVAADIEAGTPDQRVSEFLQMCEQLSEIYA
jgi:Uroporphyrinogen decarboxylase (URO-D)